MVRRIANRRNGRPQENGGPKNKRPRRSTSDQEEESNSEDEEREATVMTEKNKKINGEMQAVAPVKQEKNLSDQTKPEDGEIRTGLTNGVKVEKDLSEDRCHVGGGVKKEVLELEQSETKPYPAKPCESPAEVPAQTEQVAESNGEVDQKSSVQSGGSQPAAAVASPQSVKRMCKPTYLGQLPMHRTSCYIKFMSTGSQQFSHAFLCNFVFILTTLYTAGHYRRRH